MKSYRSEPHIFAKSSRKVGSGVHQVGQLSQIVR